MQLNDYVEIISPDVIRLKGSDVGLEEIVERYRIGYNAVEIRQDFPVLSPEQVYGAITYYLHNREAINAYLKRLPQQETGSARPIWLRSNDLSRRIRALFREHEQSILT